MILAASDPTAVETLADAVRAGRPVVMPTDTVYGLAALATDSAAIDALFELKNRPAERAIAVLVADTAQAATIAHTTRDERLLMDRFWPGALTVVVHRRTEVLAIGPADGTIGLRSPDDQFALALLRAVGPLATTSANLSGEPTPTHAATAVASLTGEVQWAVDGGVRSGSASTVVRIGPDGPEILRAGPIGEAEISSALA